MWAYVWKLKCFKNFFLFSPKPHCLYISWKIFKFQTLEASFSCL